MQEIERQFAQRPPHVSQNPRLALYSGNHYFAIRSGEHILAYAIIEIYRFKKVYLEFGPVSSGEVSRKLIFNLLFETLKNNGYWYLSFQAENADWLTSIEPDRIIQQTAGWATAFKQLDTDAVKLWGTLHQNHRRNIKKATKEGIVPVRIETEADFKVLIGIFHRMYAERRIHYYQADLEKELWALFQYITATGNGIVLKAELNGQVLGGIIVTCDSNGAFYNFGASDRKTKCPVMHLLFMKAFEILINKGIYQFDFGGYAVGTKDAQFAALNQFKDGFGVQIKTYPVRLIIGTSKIGGKLIFLLMGARTKLLRSMGKHTS